MNYKTTLSLVILVALGTVLGFGFAYQQSLSQNESEPSAAVLPPQREGTLRATADWGTVPTTIESLYDTADVVVKVTITESTTRLVSQTLANYEVVSDNQTSVDAQILEQGMQSLGIEGSINDLSEEQIQEILANTTLETEQVGEHVVHTPFTDATVKVTEVYKGEVGQEVIVMQLGGSMPAPGKGESDQLALMEFAENPLLQKGEEYILFLKDSRQNEMHAQGRTLYELVGPTGQFQIVGNQVYNAFSVYEPHSFEGIAPLPTNLSAMQDQIAARQVR